MALTTKNSPKTKISDIATLAIAVILRLIEGAIASSWCLFGFSLIEIPLYHFSEHFRNGQIRLREI